MAFEVDLAIFPILADALLRLAIPALGNPLHLLTSGGAERQAAVLNDHHGFNSSQRSCVLQGRELGSRELAQHPPFGGDLHGFWNDCG